MLRKSTHSVLREKKAHFLVPTKINTLRHFDGKNTFRRSGEKNKIRTENIYTQWIYNNPLMFTMNHR